MSPEYDAIVIGSGFGGALAAHPLVHAGWRVLMLERGDFVERGPQNWRPEGVRDLSPHYDHTTPYILAGDDRGASHSVHCVGGPSVFYGGVSLRYREGDFKATPEEANASAAWPYDYSELEPFYAAAERIIGVAGEAGMDPTEPPRSTPYGQRLPALSRVGQRISDAAERCGHAPFRLPLAINYGSASARSRCVACATCDGYACAVGAKNDIASAVLPALLGAGMSIVSGTAAIRIVVQGRRATGVECVDTGDGTRRFYSARHIIVAAGALATPHLLLASELDRMHESGKLIGRHLMRHANAIVFGIFPDRLDAAREFHKQVGINDFYFGHSSVSTPAGKLGTIQQIHSPPSGLVRSELPPPFGEIGAKMLGHMTGLIVIASDEPQYDNRVELASHVNALGMPSARIEHRYTRRDRQARHVLATAAKRILAEAGALSTFTMPVRTFSHGLGTVRIGANPCAAPLDPNHRLRGVENVLITDGSVLPSSAGVNPSLTIAATALRAGCRLAGVQPMPRIHSLVTITTRELLHV